MDRFKNVAKGGWHPSEQGMGKKTSLRGDFKGANQIASWMGKGKDTSDHKAEDHRSTPLSALKDPDSFGAPPVRRGIGNGHAASSASPGSRTAYAREGLGAPISAGHMEAQESRLEREREAAREVEEEAERRATAPPVPFRSDTTGLNTAGLPPPPKRVDAGSPAAPVTGRPKPSLPPRLPPRSAAADSPAPPSYNEVIEARAGEGVLNQSALNRLGQAGVSVPGLGIGPSSASRPPTVPARSHGSEASSPQTPLAHIGHSGQMNELQQRFARMTSGGNTSTATAQSSPTAHGPNSPMGKKAPPPPPPKKKELHAAGASSAPAPVAPPVPLASKPGR